MLYNPDWRKPHPHSLQAIVDWLEQQPPTKTYYWYSCEICLVAQYAKATGVNFHDCHNTLHKNGGIHPIAGSRSERDRTGGVYTFGEALVRIKAYLKEQEKVDA
jgi:hypothetical protein